MTVRTHGDLIVLEHQTTSTMTRYPTQSHYPNYSVAIYLLKLKSPGLKANSMRQFKGQMLACLDQVSISRQVRENEQL